MRKVRRLGQARGVPVRFVAQRGKGSHGTLYYGSARTIVQDWKRELPTGTLHAMLRQLGLTPEDLREEDPRRKRCAGFSIPLHSRRKREAD